MDSDKIPTIEFIGDGIDEIVTGHETTYEFYDLSGLRVFRPVKGKIYIVKGSDGTVRKIIY